MCTIIREHAKLKSTMCKFGVIKIYLPHFVTFIKYFQCFAYVIDLKLS